MELIQMQYFEKIASYENISKAAADLNVTQPALSNALHRLESELGYPLFDRNGKKLSLNAEGKKFRVTVKQMLNLLNQYLISSQAESLQGVITLCCSITAPIFYHYINEYRKSNPLVSFQIATGSNNQRLISDNNYDLAITPENEIPLSQRNRIFMTAVHLFVIVSRHHPLSQLSQIHFSDIENQTFVFNWRNGKVETNLSRLSKAGISPSISALVDQSIAKLQVVSSSDSIAFLYDLELPYLKNYPELAAIPVSEEDYAPFDLFLTWREDIAESAAAADFLRFLKEKCEITM